MTAECRNTARGGGAGAPNDHQDSLRANEKPTSWQTGVTHPSPQTGAQRLAPLPGTASGVTGELAASCSQKMGRAEGGATYAVVLAGPIAPFNPSGLHKPTDMYSDLSETAVSPGTVNRRMYINMSGPRSYRPDGTTNRAQVANTSLPAGQRPNKPPIFISGVSDDRAF